MDSERGRLGVPRVAQGNELGILLSYCIFQGAVNKQLYDWADYIQSAHNGNGQKSPHVTSLFPQHSFPSLKNQQCILNDTGLPCYWTWRSGPEVFPHRPADGPNHAASPVPELSLRVRLLRMGPRAWEQVALPTVHGTGQISAGARQHWLNSTLSFTWEETAQAWWASRGKRCWGIRKWVVHM